VGNQRVEIDSIRFEKVSLSWSRADTTRMQRPYQILLIASFVAFSWLSFMVVHEFGHVVSAWLSGGSVSRVVLHPMQISWTALAHNPHPRLVAWGGPILGSLFPLGLLAGAHALGLPGRYLFRFFAGFCLIANGLYLFVDAFERGGDGGTLLRHGASQWQLLVFGAIAAPFGFWLWHGLGRHFGLGVTHGKVSRGAAITSACLLAFVVAMELAFYP
jgi:uncharacterized membrane protein